MPLLEARYTLLLSACSMRLRYYIIQYVNTVPLPRKHLGTYDTKYQGIPSSLGVLDATSLWDLLSCTFSKTFAMYLLLSLFFYIPGCIPHDACYLSTHKSTKQINTHHISLNLRAGTQLSLTLSHLLFWN